MEFNEYNFGILSRAMKIEIRSANVNPVNFVNFLCIHRVFPFGSKIQIQQHEMLVSSVRMEANKKKLLWNVPKVMDPKRYASTWNLKDGTSQNNYCVWQKKALFAPLFPHPTFQCRRQTVNYLYEFFEIRHHFFAIFLHAVSHRLPARITS